MLKNIERRKRYEWSRQTLLESTAFTMRDWLTLFWLWPDIESTFLGKESTLSGAHVNLFSTDGVNTFLNSPRSGWCEKMSGTSLLPSLLSLLLFLMWLSQKSLRQAKRQRRAKWGSTKPGIGWLPLGTFNSLHWQKLNDSSPIDYCWISVLSS